MSSAGISFGGLASGLDTKAIISALVAIEERPIRALETKKTGYTKTIRAASCIPGCASSRMATTSSMPSARMGPRAWPAPRPRRPTIDRDGERIVANVLSAFARRRSPAPRRAAGPMWATV